MPNITGTFSGDELNAKNVYTSCFTLVQQSVNGQSADLGTDNLAMFNASNGETKTDGTIKTDTEHHVYGNSDHVTPCNATIKLWKRIS